MKSIWEHKFNSGVMEKNGRLAIVVMSYDGCADLWDGFFECFNRNWKDCKYPIYLITNELDYAPENFEDFDFRLIKTGKRTSWAQSMRKALESVTEEYALFLFEDYYLFDKVNNEKFAEAFEFMKANEICSMGVYGAGRYKYGTKSNYTTDYKELTYDMPYCITCGLHILKTELMVSLCKEEYSPWDFENLNSFEALNAKQMPSDEKFINLKDNYYPTYSEGVLVKGRYTRCAYKLCKKLGIKLNLTVHPIMTRRKYVYIKVKSFTMGLIPSKLKAKLKSKIQGKENK